MAGATIPLTMIRGGYGSRLSPGRRESFQLHLKNIQRRVLQQHDRLGVDDAAVADHGERLIDRQFQHLDVLALVGDAAAAADLHLRIVFGDEEVQFFGDRAGAHEGFEYLPDFAEPVAGFLLGFRAHPHLRRGVVQQARGRLDQQIVIAVDIGRITELPHQHHGALREIIGQQRRGIAAVEGLAGLRLPLAVSPPPFEGGVLQRGVVIRKHADVLDADAVGDGHEVPAGFDYGVGSRPSSHLAKVTVSWL